MAYRILSLDGGGILGLVEIVVIRRLLKHEPDLLDRIDLFAGTSTGGILALGLAAGKSPDQLINLYRKRGARIFDDSWLDDLVDLAGLTGADYDNKRLRKELRKLFGDSTLGDLRKRRVLIPTFDLDNHDGKPPEGAQRHWKPKFFHNFPNNDSDRDQLIVDVALRTSAAPTYFPSYQGYIDGGVVANNPSMAAVAEALDPRAGDAALDDIVLLSLGTGRTNRYIAGVGRYSHDWGYAQWGKQLVSIMIDGVMGVATYQCQRLLGDRLFRLDPALPKPWKLDSVKDIPEIIAFAESIPLGKLRKWIDASGF